MSNSRTNYRIGVDIGGTFTDIVALSADGSVLTRKVSSTPDDYGEGILDGLDSVLREAGIAPADVGDVVHATTVATNAVLEGKGAKTGLVTTAGFRDVLEMRRIRVPDMYNLDYRKPAPLVPRRLRREVVERMGPRGEVRTALDEASARADARRLREEGVEAVAVALLHAYANPAHELRVAQILREEMPAGTFLSCSHDVLPEIREYERTSTTIVNALLGPIVSQYLATLAARLQALGIARPLQIMQSNGGLMSARRAVDTPARILESGPAAGVIAAARVGRLAGSDHLITLDMGGTTAKTAIIENGEPAKTTEYEVGAGINLSSRLLRGAGYAIKLPFIDVSEIGAGGGSKVWFDQGGLMQVGPQSAGSVPGPVCYGIGGDEVTLTDALVALGYLNPNHLLGGALALDAQRAASALDAQVCTRLGRSRIEAAHGIYTIAASNMMRAVKAVSTFRGRDPREFTLFAFGGNGPVVAMEIARELEMPRLLVPPSPGVFSALGLLVSDPEHESLRTLFGRLDETPPEGISDAFERLQSDMQQRLVEDGHDPDAMHVQRFADLRYARQAFEMALYATEIYQEGLRIPLMKLYDAGEPNRTLFQLLEKNVRVPVEVLGDIDALVAACASCERGLERLVARYGRETFARYVEALHDHAERLMREEIAAMPDGVYEFEDWLDGMGDVPEPVRFKVTITISGDTVEIDWAGTSGQLEAAINGPLPTTNSMAYLAVRCAARSPIPNCEGFIRPITVTAPLGSVVNPTEPAACASRGIIAYRMLDAMFGALSEVAPERIPAACEGGPTSTQFSCTHEGRRYVTGGGSLGCWGGRHQQDGLDGVSNPGANMSNQPIELIEASVPMEISRYGLIENSGGPGRSQGIGIDPAERPKP